MFGSVGPMKALGALFSALFTAFTAVEKIAKSVDNIAGIAEAETDGMAKTMEVERKARLAEFINQNKASLELLDDKQQAA